MADPTREPIDALRTSTLPTEPRTSSRAVWGKSLRGNTHTNTRTQTRLAPSPQGSQPPLFWGGVPSQIPSRCLKPQC